MLQLSHTHEDRDDDELVAVKLSRPDFETSFGFGVGTTTSGDTIVTKIMKDGLCDSKMYVAPADVLCSVVCDVERQCVRVCVCVHHVRTSSQCSSRAHILSLAYSCNHGLVCCKGTSETRLCLWAARHRRSLATKQSSA